jgi:hypothetical protein
VPSLEGPGRDEVYLLPPLTLYLLYCLGLLKALAAPMHLGVDVSYPILQPFYLFQFVMQFLLQLAISMYFRTESIVTEASQRVVDPILTSVVVVEDAHPLGCGRRDLVRCEVRRGMSGSMIDRGRGPWGSHAQGVGVVCHMDGNILHLYLAPIVHDFEGDIARGVKFSCEN